MKRTRRLEMMPLGSITGAEKNPKKHAHADIGKSIGRFGYVEPVVLDERTQRLVAGHGRVQALRAAKVNGEQPPQGVEVGEKGEWLVPVLRGWSSRSDAEAQAYLVASNNLTTKGGWEDAELAKLLKELDQQAALDGTGFDAKALAELIESAGLVVDEHGNLVDGNAGVDTGAYTKKIEAPVYTPKGERPAVSELSDDSKTKELVAEIKAAKLPKDVEAFLCLAAQRHTSFDFARIAEFYCHADETTQALFERSALVIIDFDAAIENGFVQMTERLGAIADLEGFTDAN